MTVTLQDRTESVSIPARDGAPGPDVVTGPDAGTGPGSDIEEKHVVRIGYDVTTAVRDAMHDVVKCSREHKNATSFLSSLLLSLQRQCLTRGSFSIQQVYVLSDEEIAVIEELRR